MTPPPEGTPWWAWVLTVIALAVISAVAARLANRPLHREVAAVRTDAAATRHQVQNSHSTNLREDLDEIRREIARGFEETRNDIGGLRSEVRTERRERLDLGARVTHLEQGRHAGS